MFDLTQFIPVDLQNRIREHGLHKVAALAYGVETIDEKTASLIIGTKFAERRAQWAEINQGLLSLELLEKDACVSGALSGAKKGWKTQLGHNSAAQSASEKAEDAAEASGGDAEAASEKAWNDTFKARGAKPQSTVRAALSGAKSGWKSK